MVEYDVLIKNASVVMGTGKKEFIGAIGIKGDKVEAVGEVNGDAVKIIDATGLKALPGFIDAHSHAERNLLWYPQCENYIMQGITTFVGGQCGGSMAPVADVIGLPGLLSRHHFELAPYKFYPSKSTYPLEQVNEWMKEKYGWTINWRTMAEFFTQVEKKGFSTNYAPLVGHGTVRRLVMGEDYKRPSTQAEQNQMHEHIHQAMKEGCIGLSTGLDYDPDVFASDDEILEAVAQLKEYEGIYSPHWKRTGRRRGPLAGRVGVERINSLLECVDVHKKTGVRLHFAHLDQGWLTYPMESDAINKVILSETFDTITKDSKDILDVTWNTIPFFTRGGFSVMPYLIGRLAPWLRELGSREALGRWLKIHDFREEVKDAIMNGKVYISVDYNPYTNPRWAERLVVVQSKIPGIDGKTVAQIAEERKTDPFDTWLDIMAEDPDARGVRDMPVNDKNYYLFYKHPCGMLSLDTQVFDDKYESPTPPYGITGINPFSGFPIFFKKFVKEDKTLTLEEAVQATSTKAAKVYRLKNRGTLTEGSYADIVLMDLENIEIRSTELEPRRYPGGIKYVFVNGVTVVEEGKHTGARSGRVLKRT